MEFPNTTFRQWNFRELPQRPASIRCFVRVVLWTSRVVFAQRCVCRPTVRSNMLCCSKLEKRNWCNRSVTGVIVALSRELGVRSGQADTSNQTPQIHYLYKLVRTPFKNCEKIKRRKARSNAVAVFVYYRNEITSGAGGGEIVRTACIWLLSASLRTACIWLLSASLWKLCGTARSIYCSWFCFPCRVL